VTVANLILFGYGLLSPQHRGDPQLRIRLPRTTMDLLSPHQRGISSTLYHHILLLDCSLLSPHHRGSPST